MLLVRSIVSAVVIGALALTTALAQEAKEIPPTAKVTVTALVKQGFEIKTVITGLNLRDDPKLRLVRTRFLLQKSTSFFLCDTAFDLTAKEQPAIGTNWETLGGPTVCTETKFD